MSQKDFIIIINLSFKEIFLKSNFSNKLGVSNPKFLSMETAK